MSPTPLDMFVMVAAVAVLALPVLKKAASSALPGVFNRSNVTNPDAVEAWRQKWTALLITLGREIDGGEGGLNDPAQATLLNRELMWEIIGGDPGKPVVKK